MKLMSCESTHLSACHKAKSVALKTLNQFDSLEELSDPSDLDYDSDIQLLNYNSLAHRICSNQDNPLVQQGQQPYL